MFGSTKILFNKNNRGIILKKKHKKKNNARKKKQALPNDHRAKLKIIVDNLNTSYPGGSAKECIKSFPVQEVWRLFVDGVDQRWNFQTWVDYEKREPGYLAAMSSALV
jgi:hypothetical protein